MEHRTGQLQFFYKRPGNLFANPDDYAGTFGSFATGQHMDKQIGKFFRNFEQAKQFQC
jgi:hypothetical protein